MFVQALGFFVTPSMLGGLGDTMIAQFIERDMRTSVDLGAAATLAGAGRGGGDSSILAFRLFYPLEALFIRAAAEPMPPSRLRRHAPMPTGLGGAADRRLAGRDTASRLPWLC